MGQTPVVATEVFLITDIEGSTRRWAAAAEEMRRALALHDDVLAASFVTGGGEVFKHTGDGLIVRFRSAPAAVAAAVDAQRNLDRAEWPEEHPAGGADGYPRGEAEPRGDDWFGPALNRCARLLGLGHGGQVLLSGAAHALCVDGWPDGVSALDLGERPLRDLRHAEHVWQIEAAGLRPAFPALRSSDDRPTSFDAVRLPEQLTPFHGRQAEADRVTALLGEERLITLLGAGGIGKSRLALHVAATAVSAFPDGVWFCPLADLVEDDPDGVPYAVADAIGVRREEGATMLDTLASWIGQRRALLVLDNCEHVRASAAALADTLRRACPALTLLATSREPLRLPGETRALVGPLDPEAAQRAVRRAAPQLRRLGQPPLSPTTTWLTLCEQLGHMPLAIELAAARCRALSPAELALRLERRPDLLADRSRPSAQQTLDRRAGLVGRPPRPHRPPGIRPAFRVPGRLHAAAGRTRSSPAATSTSSTSSMRSRAWSTSGLSPWPPGPRSCGTPSSSRSASTAPGSSSAGELAQLAQHHATAYAELAAAIGQGLEGPDFGAWADTADRELANLRAAHRWAIQQQDPEVAVAIVAGLREYLFQRVMTEICDWNDATVSLTRGRGDDLEAEALAPAAVGWFFQRRRDEAVAAFERIRATSGRPELLAQGRGGPAGAMR